MKKYRNYLLLFSIFFVPTLVNASTGNNNFPLLIVLGMEIFNTIFWSWFVLKPLSRIVSKTDNKKTFWKFFLLRVAILIFFDFLDPSLAMIDFVGLFIGIFIVMPMVPTATNKISDNTDVTDSSSKNIKNDVVPPLGKCPKCGAELNQTSKYCSNCGESVLVEQKSIVKPSDFAPMFSSDDDTLLELFIKSELVKLGVENDSRYMPGELLKRKKILTIIFSILVYVYISLIFFHFPTMTYLVGLIILIVLYKFTNGYNLLNYLKKEIKARPSEKISNIVMNVKASFVFDNFKTLRIICFVIAIIIPLLIFKDPRIMYEKTDGGYAVRFYTFGLTNNKTATIPKTYKNENVVSLRGNTFSNMPFLEKVNLPNTITEIRGQAFKNDGNLYEVTIPNKLKYLGGGAFSNCTSLKDVSLPDTLTYMGGETFLNATSLTVVKLPKNISEIRGSTFEGCNSLESITIPDSVRRIGGHAFYGNSSLKEVNITENSNLKEIGSSAFRNCSMLYEITIPMDIYVNERAFKESPTIVRHFGEINYENIIDQSKYQYDLFETFHNYQEFKFDDNLINSRIYNTSLKLENINVVNGYNEFAFRYIDTSGDVLFTLTKDNPYKEVNENLVVATRDNSAFTSDIISLYIYYN